MARSGPSASAVKNNILSFLPAREFNLLRPNLEEVQLPHHSILHEAGEDIQFAYFLNEGLASLIVFTRDGRSVEVVIVGREGLVGTPLTVGINQGPYRVIMQLAGSGLRMKSEVFIDSLDTQSRDARRRAGTIA